MEEMIFEKKKIKMKLYEFFSSSRKELESVMHSAEGMGAICIDSVYGEGKFGGDRFLVSELNDTFSDNFPETYADFEHEFDYKIISFSDDVTYVKLNKFFEKEKITKIMDIAKSYGGVYFSNFVPKHYSGSKECGFLFESEEITDNFLKEVATIKFEQKQSDEQSILNEMEELKQPLFEKIIVGNNNKIIGSVPVYATKPTPEEFLQECIGKVERYHKSCLNSEYVAADDLDLAESALRKTAYVVKDFEEYFKAIPEFDEITKSQYERGQHFLQSYIHDFEGLTRIELEKLALERFEAIQNVDLSVKPETDIEKLRYFCKKSLQAHREGDGNCVVDGVKRFLLSTPNVKLEQMTKLIDAVAPEAVYNYPEYMPYDLIGQSVYYPPDKNYSYSVKQAVREELEEVKMTESKNFKDDEITVTYNDVKNIAAGLEIGTYAEMPSAKFTQFVGLEDFIKVNEVAKQHGGSYSKDAKQFLFETVEGRDAFRDEFAKMNVEAVKKTPSAKTNQTEKNWSAKKTYAEKRIADLTKSVNETLPERLVEIFKDGLKVHCPHGAVEQVVENGKVIYRKANYYSGLNAIILAAEMQEKNFASASFVDSRTVYAMREKGLEIDKKKESPEIPVAQDSTLIFGTFTNKNGDRILDTREVMNVTQLEGKDVPPEETVVNPREDFMFEKTLNEVLNKVIEAQKNNLQIDLVEISKQAKDNAFKLCRKQDAEKQKRIDAIKNIDVNAKQQTNAEKLQRFCKKSMEAHGENYKGYVVDGVKRFLISTPSTKLEQMTKLIDYVAPAAVFNTKNYNYSEFVKTAVRNDKNFATKLSEVKKSRSTFSR